MNTTVPYNLKPYTREELIARAEEGRRQIAMGNYCDIEDLLRELEEDFKKDLCGHSLSTPVEELEMEAV